MNWNIVMYRSWSCAAPIMSERYWNIVPPPYLMSGNDLFVRIGVAGSTVTYQQVNPQDVGQV